MSLDILNFAKTPIPDDTPLDDLPPDDAPPSTYEYACGTCGVELFYGGKGRHPKFCDEHKGTKTTRGKGGGNNATLARQASATLSQLNSLIALSLMLPAVPMLGDNPMYLPETAGALATASEPFDEMTYNALLTDPALCKMILRGGAAGGKIALLIAYGTLAAAVAPVGVNEFRERKSSANRAKIA